MNKHVVVFIQARMGSSRLPGKVMTDINGEPMLWHVVSRLKQCPLISEVVVVTTTDSKDDAIEQFCQQKKIFYFRGSEEDVLDRYYQAALAHKADVVVRITSDCPLIDPIITEKVIRAYLNNSAVLSGASNVVERTFPRGLDTEVFSFAALEKVWQMAQKPYEREHVTVFMYEHPELFKIISVTHKENFSHLRWTVDELDDLRLVKEIYRIMKENGQERFGFQDVMALLKKNPELNDINSSVKQKIIHK